MRDNYWSFLKGVAIIAVVFIHTPLATDNYYCALVLRQFVNFAVAFFVFLSGYFVKNDLFSWLTIRRYLFPYLIWSVLWFSETTISGGVPITTWKIINSMFFGGAFFPLYFLSILIQLKILTPFLYRRINKYNYNALKDGLWYITPVYLVCFYLYCIILKRQPLIYAQIFPAWFIFYYYGIYKKNRLNLIDRNTSHKGSIIGLILLLGMLSCQIVEATIMYDSLGLPFLAASQIKFSSFAYSFVICYFACLLHSEMKENFVSRLGDSSFGIYIIHIPVKKFVDIVAYKIPIVSDGIMNQLFVVLMTLLISYLIIVCLSKIMHNPFLQLIGLK